MLLHQGVQVHGAVAKQGLGFHLMLNNDLIDVYGKCVRMDAACAVSYVWTALMYGHIQNGNAEESLFLFSQMGLSGVKSNEFTFSMNLKACGMLNLSDIGIQIHDICVKTGFDMMIVVGNSIVDMCSKQFSAHMFYFMPVRNIISWNSMIAGYTIAGFGKKAVVLFQKILENRQAPDEFTFTSTLKAFTDLGAMREGSQIHAFLIITGFPYLITTSIAARRVFGEVEQKHVISWSAIILGYAQEGNLAEAMDLFRQLRESDIQADGFVLSSMIGVFADFALVEQGKQMHACTIKVPSGLDISVCNSIMDMYLICGAMDETERFFAEMSTRNVISWTIMITGYSCSHSGLIEEGQEYFYGLCNDHRMKARVEHYACMVDLLGRAGRLKGAKDIIDSMPLKPNIGIWQALFSACRMRGDLELGREVGEILLRLDGDNPVNYMMLSNIYADAGVKYALRDVEEESKEESLRVHSEKLAIGLALVCGGWKERGRVIRVFKSLRVCVICHQFIEGLSKILKVVFVVRDANRFHRFENGLCSCRDH
ncbi:hypothetical protein P3X46_007306 [Hevea brasiliensis]|uniref:DYW domain-containing protein n=1 Tax=Hevea brasiliensis TaxID=3981 RepID=A0ABQ9MVS1_HEVBR|nr:hypothetical protein P3X46_007306 [Hevea brasiliensis]